MNQKEINTINRIIDDTTEVIKRTFSEPCMVRCDIREIRDLMLGVIHLMKAEINDRCMQKEEKELLKK